MALRLPAPPRPPGHGPTAGPGRWWCSCPPTTRRRRSPSVVARVPELVLGRRVECLVVDGRLRRPDGRATPPEPARPCSVGRPTAGWGRPSGRALPPPSSGGGGGRLLRRRPRVRPGRAGAAGRAHPGGAGRLRGRLPVRRPDPAHAAPAPPRQPGPHRAAPVRGQDSDRRRPERLPGPVGSGRGRRRDCPRLQLRPGPHPRPAGQGYRYLEVPIGYQYRTTGRSFVRPLRYLRQVVPAVWRELNRPEQGCRPR